MSIRSEAANAYKYTPTFSSNRWYWIPKLIQTRVYNELFILYFIVYAQPAVLHKNDVGDLRKAAVFTWHIEDVGDRIIVSESLTYFVSDIRHQHRFKDYNFIVRVTYPSVNFHKKPRFSISADILVRVKNINGIKYLWRWLVILSIRKLRCSLRLVTECSPRM